MTAENDPIQTLREKIGFLLSNRLTYPKTLLSIARERLLTESEIQKGYKCFEECVQFAEAEILLFKAHYGDKLL